MVQSTNFVQGLPALLKTDKKNFIEEAKQLL